MKNILILLIFNILFFINCKNKVEEPDYNVIYEPGKMELGFVKAKKNGKNWLASGILYTTYKGFFEISGTTQSKEGFKREGFFISKIPKKIGTYKIQRKIDVWGKDEFVSAQMGTNGSDGDVFVNGYDIDETQTNYIEVTELTSDIAKGKFEIHLNINQPVSTYRKELLNLNFTEGNFEIKF